MRITGRTLQLAAFPLALLAFVGIGTPYLYVIFTPTTRWFYLPILGLMFVKSRQAWGVLGRTSGLAVLAYMAWCLLTTAWSIVPSLSLLKSAAQVPAVLIFLMGGYLWSTRTKRVPTLFYLAPVAAISLASVVTGRGADTDNIELYYGLTGNPNFLGIITASSAPLILFLLHRSFYKSSSLAWRGLTLGATVLIGVLLWWAGSRGGVLCAVVVVVLGLMGLQASKLVTLAVLAIGVAASVGAAAPEVQGMVYERLILKYSPDGDVFYTRRDAWQDSEEGARQGGVIGLGYGASYGDTTFDADFSSVGYGREKGNSQLAIVEETGLVGLALYAVVLFAMFGELFSCLWRLPPGETKLELALTTGLLAGLLAQSCFEAWWTSPGSAGSAIFWTTAGVGLGLVRQAELVRRPAGSRYFARNALRSSVRYES